MELARVAVDSEQAITMTVPPGRGQVIFTLKDVEVASQLIEGKFPDYNQIIPRSYKTRTVLTTQSILSVHLQTRAEVFARCEGSNVVRMNIKPAGDSTMGSVEISAINEETGKSDEGIDANIEGTNLLIAFNVKFLREVLEVVKTPTVALETTAPNTPGVIKPVGDESYVHVIMPMHL